MIDEHERIRQMIAGHREGVIHNPSRPKLIQDAVTDRNALLLEPGALATWTPRHSTGRSPEDTYIVRRPGIEASVDWNSPYAKSMDRDTFEMLFSDTISQLSSQESMIVLDKVVGADSAYALPVTSVVDNALAGLFIDNMFLEMPEDIEKSCFFERPFFMLVHQYGKPEAEKYRDRLRLLSDGSPLAMAVVMDLERRVGVVLGSCYMGTIKKMAFTVMNFYLPEQDILPLHCSANEGDDGRVAVFLGLSGTGKTTLSTDGHRALIGDDEHGWSDNGIANFENGCYAKLYRLDPAKEPDVYDATFHRDNYLAHGALVENLMVYPDGTFELDDDRLTQNSRASYPLRYLSGAKTPSMGDHPSTMIFLTADAHGVLPPISRLTDEQALFWYLMGYTSKLAGTETGVTEPQSVFSRFFGAPFMLRLPGAYLSLLEHRLKKHRVRVFLVNTGWTGGSYPEGNRLDITLTRAMVKAALSGDLDEVEYQSDGTLGLAVPTHCPGVPQDVLLPVNTWRDKDAYRKKVDKLAGEFRAHAEKAFAGRVPAWVESKCPPTDVQGK